MEYTLGGTAYSAVMATTAAATVDDFSEMGIAILRLVLTLPRWIGTLLPKSG